MVNMVSLHGAVAGILNLFHCKFDLIGKKGSSHKGSHHTDDKGHKNDKGNDQHHGHKSEHAKKGKLIKIGYVFFE